MRVIVCGGRAFGPYLSVARELMNVWLENDRPVMTIIQGGGSGADEHARHVALAQGYPLETFPADWNEYGKGAGPIRNQEMVDAGADLLVAFPGGRGTADCVRRAETAGIPVRRVS